MKEILNTFKDHLLIKFFITIAALLLAIVSNAQVDKNSVLFKTLKAKDSIIFERTFNKCELEKLEPIIAENFEFYHDKGGIQDRTAFMKSVQKNVCGNPNFKLLRKLVKGSLEVFPLENKGKLYGAIQRGKHTFHIRKNGKVTPDGVALFTHLWILENNTWRLKRVLSFNHLPYTTLENN